MLKRFKLLSTRTKIISIVTSIIILLIVVVSVCSISINNWSAHKVSYLHTHLAKISSNNQLLGNKNANGKYNIIFYMDNCNHCQHTVPKAYVYNKFSPKNIFTRHHVQYRDIANNTNNLTLANDTHKNSVLVPNRTTLWINHGKIVKAQRTNNLKF